MYTIEDIERTDPEIAGLIQAEIDRQNSHLELIASENWASKAVMSALGSVLTNKYAEGYPGHRYYGGCECVDQIEDLARERAKKLFGCTYANVQPHSGAQANMAVFYALLKPGDTFMGMRLDEGGHLSHGSSANISGSYFHQVPYGVNADGWIDYDACERIAKECHPKMIIGGASAYCRIIDFKRLREIADEVGAYLTRQAEKALSDAQSDYGYRAESLLGCDIAVLKAALILLIKKYNIMPTHQRVDLLLEILQNGGAVELDKSHTFVCDRGLLRMRTAAGESFALAFDKPMRFSCDGEKYAVSADNSLFENKSLTFRNRREGDSFSFQIRKITKPLGKALREIDLPRERRDRVLCLCEDSVVLWCEPLGWSEQGKIYQQTQHLSIEKLQ